MMTERAYERAREQKEPAQIQAMISLQILCSPFKREQTKSSQEKKSKTNQRMRQLRVNQRRLENRGLSED
jgi:hypothetical protein